MRDAVVENVDLLITRTNRYFAGVRTKENGRVFVPGVLPFPRNG